jgi:hypothetical protein
MSDFDITELYDGSFKGVQFWEQFNGGFGDEPETEEENAIFHIPGGNRTVVQGFGKVAGRLDLVVSVNAAGLTSLRNQVGSSGSLVYHAGTITARLTKVGQPKRAGYGIDAVNTTLSFLT